MNEAAELYNYLEPHDSDLWRALLRVHDELRLLIAVTAKGSKWRKMLISIRREANRIEELLGILTHAVTREMRKKKK